MGFVTSGLVSILNTLPEFVVWRFAERYIAGSEMKDGLRVMSDLNSHNLLTTMDILGESTENLEIAHSAANQYLDLIRLISDTEFRSHISLKLTQMGLNLSFNAAHDHAVKIAQSANAKGLFFRLDMEDAQTTDQIFEIYRSLRKKLPEVGVVVQAYLKRSVDDVESLMRDHSVNLRICKGIYKESPKIAFQNRQEIRTNYIKILRIILDGGGYPAIATHDTWLIDAALGEIIKRKLTPEKYEFQMLHGVGEHLRQNLLKNGHRVRIYVPFGPAWMAYSLRRFRENPVLLAYVIKNLFSMH
jgi:proline dehydrogenase